MLSQRKPLAGGMEFSVFGHGEKIKESTGVQMVLFLSNLHLYPVLRLLLVGRGAQFRERHH